MNRFVLMLGFLFIFSISGNAQTKVSSVNDQNIKVYSFTSTGGTVDVSISWLNQSANLIMVVACDEDDPTIFGGAAGGLDRFARLQSGIPANLACELGVTSTVNGSKYWLNFASGTTASLARNQGGDVSRGFDGSDNFTALTLAIENEIARLRRHF